MTELPFTQVDAFVTQDQGQTWRQFASQRPGGGLSIPQDRTSGRLGFTAESDGLYGFFIVLHNAAGASSPPPTSGTAAQQWIRVDREAPIVQILEVRPDEHFIHGGNMRIHHSYKPQSVIAAISRQGNAKITRGRFDDRGAGVDTTRGL